VECKNLDARCPSGLAYMSTFNPIPLSRAMFNQLNVLALYIYRVRALYLRCSHLPAPAAAHISGQHGTTYLRSG
jgi:hypothetical protein